MPQSVSVKFLRGLVSRQSIRSSLNYPCVLLVPIPYILQILGVYVYNPFTAGQQRIVTHFSLRNQVRIHKAVHVNCIQPIKEYTNKTNLKKKKKKTFKIKILIFQIIYLFIILMNYILILRSIKTYLKFLQGIIFH